jgi:hypothetical protein
MPDTHDLAGMTDPYLLAGQARQHFPTGAHPGHQPHEHPGVSVREVQYRGHVIRVETSYRITVDGRPVTGHVIVGTDGRVHYHSIPNQQFESAVDMVKRIIDLTPPDRPRADEGHYDGSHEGQPEGHHH